MFLEIHNIHVMRESLRKLKEIAYPADSVTESCPDINKGGAAVAGRHEHPILDAP